MRKLEEGEKYWFSGSSPLLISDVNNGAALQVANSSVDVGRFHRKNNVPAVKHTRTWSSLHFIDDSTAGLEQQKDYTNHSAYF